MQNLYLRLLVSSAGGTVFFGRPRPRVTAPEGPAKVQQVIIAIQYHEAQFEWGKFKPFSQNGVGEKTDRNWARQQRFSLSSSWLLSTFRWLPSSSAEPSWRNAGKMMSKFPKYCIEKYEFWNLTPTQMNFGKLLWLKSVSIHLINQSINPTI